MRTRRRGPCAVIWAPPAGHWSTQLRSEVTCLQRQGLPHDPQSSFEATGCDLITCAADATTNPAVTERDTGSLNHRPPGCLRGLADILLSRCIHNSPGSRPFTNGVCHLFKCSRANTAFPTAVRRMTLDPVALLPTQCSKEIEAPMSLAIWSSASSNQVIRQDRLRFARRAA